MTTARMEAFSDGVIAILITVMVLGRSRLLVKLPRTRQNMVGV